MRFGNGKAATSDGCQTFLLTLQTEVYPLRMKLPPRNLLFLQQMARVKSRAVRNHVFHVAFVEDAQRRLCLGDRTSVILSFCLDRSTFNSSAFSFFPSKLFWMLFLEAEAICGDV